MITCLLWIGVAIQAQEQDSPLVVFLGGNMLVREGNTLQAFRICQPDESLAGGVFPSPDGSRFIMTAVPRKVEEAIAELGFIGDAPIGLNLWLCDIANESLTRFRLFPGGDEPFAGEIPIPEVLESRPVWSPDGQLIAWSQRAVADDSASFVIYEPPTNTFTEIPVAIPPSGDFPSAPAIMWGEAGLHFSVSMLNQETFESTELIITYSPSGERLGEVAMTPSSETDFFTRQILVDLPDGSQRIALRSFEQGWLLLDPISGEQQPLNGLPALYSPAAPQGLALAGDIDAELNYTWLPVGSLTGAGNLPDLRGIEANHIAVSPGGGAFAYADTALHIWENGTIIAIANSSDFAIDFSAAIFWGSTAWRIAEAGVSSASAADALPTCPGVQQSRLSVGSFAQVIPGAGANNVRDAAGTNSNTIGQIPEGGVFTVLDGPVCADGFAWYQVDFNGLTGWTAEGDSSNYWLEPVRG